MDTLSSSLYDKYIVVLAEKVEITIVDKDVIIIYSQFSNKEFKAKQRIPLIIQIDFRKSQITTLVFKNTYYKTKSSPIYTEYKIKPSRYSTKYLFKVFKTPLSTITIVMIFFLCL